MKLSEGFFYTIREDIKEDESISGSLLVKSGMIKKTSSGIYMYMPLGFKVLQKIQNIVREEMNKTGACELLMPCLVPEEIYIASGRRSIFGKNMFTLKDQFDRSYSLGPTHEELFVEAAKAKVQSYKDLPFNLYQMATKFRDETRARYGLIRVREFIMKDAYSFDCDLDGLDRSYQKMFEAYQHIFDRCHLQYKTVKADTGAMGGLLSEEFQAVTDIGEDVLVLCSECGYASNIEVSECVLHDRETKEAILEKELIETPSSHTVSQLVESLDVDEHHIVKTLIYKIDDQFYAFLVAGDREINEVKIEKLLGAKSVSLAEEEDVIRLTGANVGFAGPIGLSIPIIVDQDIPFIHNFVVGANQTGYHYKNVNIRDFSYQQVADIKNVVEGDACPCCHKSLIFKKGIEIGNTLKPVYMGCYGIGIGRVMAAIIEQNHDEHGMIFPISIAPYTVGIVVIDPNDPIQKECSEVLYQQFQDQKIDVLLDDRIERPGVKFKDMDLIGIPIRITIGKKIQEQIVEIKMRTEGQNEEISYLEVVSEVERKIQKNS